MRCSYIIKGFIDPRRGDTITVNFSFPDKEWDAIPDHGQQTIISKGFQLFIIISKKYPWIKNLPGGREQFLLVNLTSVYRFSGNGPCPPYPYPIMTDADAPPCVEMEINLFECKNECPSCRDGFCHDTAVLRYGTKECVNFKE